MTQHQSDADPEQLVLRRKRHVQRVRDLIWTDGVDGGITVDAKRKLAIAAMSYWDVLRDYRDESVVDDDDWPDMQPIHSRIGETTKVAVEAPGFLDRGTTSKEVPAVAELDAATLIDITEQLDVVAAEMGFGVDISQSQSQMERR